MKKLRRFVLLTTILVALSGAQQPVPSEGAPRRRARFQTLDIYIDPQGQPLAAYQLEWAGEPGQVQLLSIEGGQHPAFVEPPYHDRTARGYHRVIVGAFNTGQDLPVGRTRVATLHVRVTGDQDPEYAIRLDVAATADGSAIRAVASVEEGGQG